jgi:hypothetical protein
MTRDRQALFYDWPNIEHKRTGHPGLLNWAIARGRKGPMGRTRPIPELNTTATKRPKRRSREGSVSSLSIRQNREYLRHRFHF